jgi:PQQ-dependent catabolism-associated CXXCW motif protein
MCLALTFWSPQALSGEVAEPATYRMEEYRAPVPATLKGAKVVTTDQVQAMIEEKSAILIDVMPHTPKPAQLPAGTIWRDKVRKNIPGSVWLPNTGYGALSAETSAYFENALRSETRANPLKAVLFYCMTDCWMSWNAAKRAIALGYKNVVWYPLGADGWEKAGHELVVAQPFKVEK